MIPKYSSVNTSPVTFPASGTGVTESLALDQAPLTRMTSLGTLVMACGWLGAVSWGELCPAVLWPPAGKVSDKVETSNKNES